MPKKVRPSSPVPRVGWPLTEWCRAAGISDSIYYALDDDRKPESVLLGPRKRIVLEPPADWLRRVGTVSAAA
jgi:hypothetical protein